MYDRVCYSMTYHIMICYGMLYHEQSAANPGRKHLASQGFDPNICLILRGGTPWCFLEAMTQRCLVCEFSICGNRYVHMICMCMYICVYICIHVYVYTCIDMYIYIYIYICICMYTHT